MWCRFYYRVASGRRRGAGQRASSAVLSSCRRWGTRRAHGSETFKGANYYSSRSRSNATTDSNTTARRTPWPTQPSKSTQTLCVSPCRMQVGGQANTAGSMPPLFGVGLYYWDAKRRGVSCGWLTCRAYTVPGVAVVTPLCKPNLVPCSDRRTDLCGG